MLGPINPDTASPTEYLRYLQEWAARQSARPGGWRSAGTEEVLRERAELEAHLASSADALAESSGLDEEEAEELRTVIRNNKRVLDSNMPEGVLGNPYFYAVLTDLVREVELTIARLGYKVPEEVTFGALPTGQINGLACAVPAGGLIVALDDGVFTFFNSLAKTVATFYQVERMPDGGGAFSMIDGDVARAVGTNREGNRRWLETVTATFVYGHPEQAPLWPSPVSRNVLVDSFLIPSEMFIVAHEFAHLILGHYGDGRDTSKRHMLGDVEIDDLDTSRRDELEADRLGLEIVREHYRRIGASADNTRWAIYFLFGSLNTLSLDGTRGDSDQSSTHPTNFERLQELLRQLAKEDGTAVDATTFSTSVYDVMQQLFFHNFDRYFEWRELAINGIIPWSITPRPRPVQLDKPV